MIDINKEMQWDEVRDVYGGKVLFMRNISVGDDGRPVVVYVYCVLENVYDADVTDEMERNGNNGYRAKIPLNLPDDVPPGISPINEVY